MWKCDCLQSKSGKGIGASIISIFNSLHENILQIFGCLTYQQFAHGWYNSTHCHPVSSVRAVVIISPSTQTIFKHCFISDDDDLCQPVAGYEVEYCLQRITKKIIEM